MYDANRENELYHYGVLGMKWGVRRAARQATVDSRTQYKKASKELDRAINRSNRTLIGKKRRAAAQANLTEKAEAYDKAEKAYKTEYKKAKADAVDKLYSKQNKAANKAVNEMSTGKAIGQSLLLGSYGALKYNEAKARGQSTGKAAVEGILYNTANNFTYGTMSTVKYLDNRFARKN